MHVCFLLGAGVSFDLLPRSRKITEIVESGACDDLRVCRHSDGSYDLAPPGPNFDLDKHHVENAIKLLEWLKCRFWMAPPPDYEWYFYACQQLYDGIMGNQENALLEPVLAEFEKATSKLAPGPLSEGAAQPDRILREVMRYIKGIVWLAPAPTTPLRSRGLDRAFRAVVQACDDLTSGQLSVITLNHDTLLEQAFERARLRFEDGFGTPEAKFRENSSPASVRFWRGYQGTRNRHRVIKVHGSIDWWRLRPEGADWSGERMARCAIPPLRLSRHGKAWDTLAPRPEMLVGTFNKVFDYSRPFNLQRYAAAYDSLSHSDALVIAGYSFRDQGVNGLLTDWYYSKQGRKLAVISPDLVGSTPPHTARGAISGKWADWVKSGRLTPMPQKFANATWSAIRSVVT